MECFNSGFIFKKKDLSPSTFIKKKEKKKFCFHIVHVPFYKQNK